MSLVKVQGHEYIRGSPSEDAGKSGSPFHFSPTFSKAPFNVEELEKKNRRLENLVRKKFINGDVKPRDGGSENFFCDIEFGSQGAFSFSLGARRLGRLLALTV